MPEFELPPANMYDAKWKVIFSLFSWWYSSDKRVFVISNRWLDSTNTRLEYIELLEQNNELSKIISYPEFFEQFRAGRLQRTSLSQDEPQPRLGAAGAALWSDRY